MNISRGKSDRSICYGCNGLNSPLGVLTMQYAVLATKLVTAWSHIVLIRRDNLAFFATLTIAEFHQCIKLRRCLPLALSY